MIELKHIKGILFDYGGTIDSNGVHWAEVIYHAYEAEGFMLDKTAFRDAYVHGEKTLAKNPIIRPHHTFADMLQRKIEIQFARLKENGFPTEDKMAHAIANRCYAFAARSVDAARPVIAAIAQHYSIALVSNFYGNITAVLTDFALKTYFPTVIESAVVGVRKPDPQIFRLGMEALQLKANEVVMIGDSYDKDIVPAICVGCRTIWLKKTGWDDYTGEETADVVISDFADLKKVLLD